MQRCVDYSRVSNREFHNRPLPEYSGHHVTVLVEVNGRYRREDRAGEAAAVDAARPGPAVSSQK